MDLRPYEFVNELESSDFNRQMSGSRCPECEGQLQRTQNRLPRSVDDSVFIGYVCSHCGESFVLEFEPKKAVKLSELVAEKDGEDDA